MTAKTPLGATPAEWSHFQIILGLENDLLPIVCDTQAPISQTSSLKKLGKTPSQYNRNREVVGFKDWTNKVPTAAELLKWTKEHDYGICLQTRRVRALDVDVPDANKAELIDQFIEAQLGQKLPKRFRANSGKFLLAFELEGPCPHAEMEVDGGIVEFLGEGQQFVAVATHESGVSYQWDGGLPNVIPTLSKDQFSALWDALTDLFATGDVQMGEGRERKRGQSIEKNDPVGDLLKTNGLVLGADKNKSLLIKCPFSDEHSGGEDGDGSTVYFPAGTNGYEQGHFKCLHAHCKKRHDDEFIAKLDLFALSFEVVEVEDQKKPWPKFIRNKQGLIYAFADNVAKALRRSDICLWEIGFDQFRDEIMKAEAGTQQWTTVSDADYVRIRIQLGKIGFMAVGRELARDCVMLVADENRFDSAQTWLSSLAWDGVPRVEKFLETYMGVASSPYATAVNFYLWTAMAGRVMQPGIKCDMVPILIGPQGQGKSSGVAAMVPSLEFFTEVSFTQKEDDLARLMRGRLLAEIGELRGLNSKDLESIKAFVTRQQESWVPKYREFASSYLRRIVFIGTTNADEFLADETGNRRFLPIKTPLVQVALIKRDCLQLWAEAKGLFDITGVLWHGLEQLAKPTHEQHMISDPWDRPIRDWLVAPDPLTQTAPSELPHIFVDDVLTKALGFEKKQMGRREYLRVAKIMKACGFKSQAVRDKNKVTKAYVTLVTDAQNSTVMRQAA